MRSTSFASFTRFTILQELQILQITKFRIFTRFTIYLAHQWVDFRAFFLTGILFSWQFFDLNLTRLRAETALLFASFPSQKRWWCLALWVRRRRMRRRRRRSLTRTPSRTEPTERWQNRSDSMRCRPHRSLHQKRRSFWTTMANFHLSPLQHPDTKSPKISYFHTKCFQNVKLVTISFSKFVRSADLICWS